MSTGAQPVSTGARPVSTVFELAQSWLPPDLVAAGSRSALADLAESLPPLRAVGFEIRLAAGDDEVDLQLSARARRGEPESLSRFLATTSARSPGWAAVRRLSDACSQSGGTLADTVEEIWLEFDHPPPGAPRPYRLEDLAPSIFTPLHADATAADAGAVLRCIVGASFDASALLNRIARATPAPARISDIGVMLSRAVPVLRVHVSPVPLDRIRDFLAALDWGGDVDEAYRLAQLLLDQGELLVLCLDILTTVDGGTQILPRLGLECFVTQRRGVDPRWKPLLTRLVESGVAAPGKAAALLQWPGGVTPMDVPDAWPDELIVSSLGEPADSFAVVERRLSHVKLTTAPGAAPVAKAYFGAGVVWEKAREVDVEPDPSTHADARLETGSGAGAGAGKRTIEDARHAAVTGLVAARNQGGWWREFPDVARAPGVASSLTRFGSDEWVSAYVAASLVAADDRRARAAAEHALDMLLARRPDLPGWGYHVRVPPDADSTSWVLRLAGALGVPLTGRLARGRTFVAGLVGPHGAVATYERTAREPLSTFLGIGGSYDGWCAEHACVTAAAATLGIDAGLARYLVDAQRPDGSWRGYWWEDDEYTTALAAQALAGTGGHDEAVARATTWALRRIGADGAVRSQSSGRASAFATALAVQAVVAGGSRTEHDRVHRATRWLVEHQRDDGLWAPSALLRVPAPHVLDPVADPQACTIYLDDSALFTSATVLTALSLVAPRT